MAKASRSMSYDLRGKTLDPLMKDNGWEQEALICYSCNLITLRLCSGFRFGVMQVLLGNLKAPGNSPSACPSAHFGFQVQEGPTSCNLSSNRG